MNRILDGYGAQWTKGKLRTSSEKLYQPVIRELALVRWS